MASKSVSPSGWVQALQGLVARELVEGMGVSGRRAAELLGIAPSAVSQYLSGRRLRTLFPAFASREDARRVARRVAQALAGLPSGKVAPPRLLLEGAAELAEKTGVSKGVALGAEGPAEAVPDRELGRALRRRVVGEQAAVAGCMHLAQKASDSLRHAEIVASLATHMDRGTASTSASGITRRDVEKLIQAERDAEKEGPDLSRWFGGTMGLLAASMEADERKHDELLRGLLE